MKKLFGIIMAFLLLQLAGNAMAGKPRGSVYLEGKTDVAIVLCHGRNQYPKWQVVNPLRKGVNKVLGYHTLSLQMPAEDGKNWRNYKEDFPKAYQTIKAAADFLRNEKGVKTLYLMGHSMGSRMATAYLASTPNHGYAGFIGVGVRNGGGEPLDSNANLRQINLPVIDVFGNGGNGKDSDHASDRSDMVSNRYVQVMIDGADHKFNSRKHEKQMVEAVLDWLKKRKAK